MFYTPFVQVSTDIEPISTSYVVATTPLSDNDVLTDPISEKSNISPIPIPEDPVEDALNDPHPSPDYTYIHLPISKAPANIRFVYAHFGNTFQEANKKTSYRLHDVGKLSGGLSTATSCFQSYDISRFKKNARLACSVQIRADSSVFSG